MYDIGSPTMQFNDLFLGGDATIGGDLTVGGNFTGNFVFTREVFASTAVPIVLGISVITTEINIDTVSSTGTLPNGTTLGQLKVIIITGFTTGDLTISITTGLNSTLKFTAVGQSAFMTWTPSGWAIIGGRGAEST